MSKTITVLIAIIILSLSVYLNFVVHGALIKYNVEQLLTEVNEPNEQWIVMEVTAYCPCEQCCGQYADGVTASGYRIQAGDRFVAGPPWLPYLTVLDIPGYGLAPVLDRGGMIKGFKIDVYFDTHEEALNWGIRYLKVRIN